MNYLTQPNQPDHANTYLIRSTQYDSEFLPAKTFLRRVVKGVERLCEEGKEAFEARRWTFAKTRWEEALKELDSGIDLGWTELDSNDVERKAWKGGIARVKIVGNLGGVDAKLGKWEEALKQRNLALKLLSFVAFPTHEPTTKQISECAFAEQFFKLYVRRAELFEKFPVGRLQEALQDWEIASCIKPRDAATNASLRACRRLLEKTDKQTHYETLGVTRSATDDEIKKAYRRLALLNHPDKVKPEERALAEKRFKVIGEGMYLLTNLIK